MAEVVARVSVEIGDRGPDEVMVVEGDSPAEVWRRVADAFGVLAVETRLQDLEFASGPVRKQEAPTALIRETSSPF